MNPRPNHVAFAGASGRHPVPLPRINPWIQWVRACHYRAADLQHLCQVSSWQLESWANGILHRPVRHWLEEVQFWDAACLLTLGWSPTELETALNVGNKARFWQGFHNYHRFEPRQLAQTFREQHARRIEAIGSLVGPDSIPPEFLPLWPWENALRALSPLKPEAQPVEEPSAAPNRSLLVQHLHRGISEQQLLAQEALIALVTQPIHQWLHGRFKDAESEQIADATTDAILDYLRRPNGYSPTRGATLWSFLHQIAWRHLRDLERSAGRRKAREELRDPTFFTTCEESCVLLPTAANKQLENDHEAQPEGAAATRQVWILEFLEQLENRDRDVMALVLAGVRPQWRYAEVLDLTNEPETEQQTQITRTKKRLRTAFRRWMRKRARRPNHYPKEANL